MSRKLDGLGEESAEMSMATKIVMSIEGWLGQEEVTGWAKQGGTQQWVQVMGGGGWQFNWRRRGARQR